MKGVKRSKSSHKKRAKPRGNSYLVILTFIGVLVVGYFFINQQTNCANALSCIKDLSGKYEQAARGIFMGKTVDTPPPSPERPQSLQTLGESTFKDKYIFIDLTRQRLEAYEGTDLIYEFPVSTGKWGATPTGEFRIWIKLRYTRMTGGNVSLGTYYDLPNVPHTMYFYNDEIPQTRGFGIHGAYWHNNFGHPMSHGCINVALDDVVKLYDWANPPSTGYTTHASNENPGTPIIIYGETPIE